MRLFWLDLKRAVLSWGFLGAVLGTFAVYVAGAWVDLPWGVNDVLYYYNVSAQIGDYKNLLVLLALLPYAICFASEWNHNVTRYAVIRSNATKYAVSKAAATAIGGGLALAVGLAVFLFVLGIQFPLVDVDRLSEHSFAGYGYGAFLKTGQFVLYYLFQVIQIFFVGAFWSMVGLVVSAYMPHGVVILSAPFMISYVLSIISTKLHIPNYLNIRAISRGVFRLTDSPSVNLLFVALYLTGLTVVLACVFVRKMKRRLANA